jgi:hypothetical protein
MLSEVSQSPVMVHSNQKKGLLEFYPFGEDFRSLKLILERGFQRQAEGKIS